MFLDGAESAIHIINIDFKLSRLHSDKHAMQVELIALLVCVIHLCKRLFVF